MNKALTSCSHKQPLFMFAVNESESENLNANEIPHSGAILGREAGGCLCCSTMELHISFIWELNVLRHPSNLGFVSTIPYRQRERRRRVGWVGWGGLKLHESRMQNFFFFKPANLQKNHTSLSCISILLCIFYKRHIYKWPQQKAKEGLILLHRNIFFIAACFHWKAGAVAPLYPPKKHSVAGCACPY